MPGAKIVRTWEEQLEFVSLSGTLSLNGNHIHIGFIDIDGKAFGGHLKDGSIIYSTAEIIIGEIPNLNFFLPGY